MDDSSSDGSLHEEEVLRNFDAEAHEIVRTKTIAKKSADRYLLVYNTYKTWREENKKSLSASEENNLIVYFEGLKEKLKPPTLWSVWSMLKKTLIVNDNIDISHSLNLKSLIKNNAKGWKPRKAFVLRWPQIIEFMNDDPDDIYLAMKVILIFGICGCMRCKEITELLVQDVEDLGDKYLISINDNKNDYPGQFVIGNMFYKTVKKYISLRPSGNFSERFFIRYYSGRCYRQTIGRHTIGGIPQKIATFLQLQNPQRFTGHCFRRTSATLLSDSGANMQMIKQLGRWRSDVIAQGYIENSMHNRQMIFDGIVQKSQKSTHMRLSINERPTSAASPSAVSMNAHQTNMKPPTYSSAKAQMNIETRNDSLDLNVIWADFDEDFIIDDVPVNDISANDINSIPLESTLNEGFTTARNKPIPVPVINETDINNNKKQLFTNKPPIKLCFKNEQKTQSTPTGKSKTNEVIDNKKDMDSVLKERGLNLNNCILNNCVFNFNSCTCNKENNV